MWLLPHLSSLSAAAIRIYYRASRDGETVPAAGPVLIVGNHPNSLLDPAFLSWAAGRPVRFLAKAPLFTNPLVGWLVRGSGSIPVYRKQDDPSLTAKNDETFRAVHEALAGGHAVALFPEGISHSQPALAPLKTGAARIALGAYGSVGRAFPIIPVGLFFRRKDRFRSEAHVTVGAPVGWEDLAARTADDQEAVRELTARIDRAMRQVTLNLARWEDEPVVRTAEAIWSASRDADNAPGARVARFATAAGVLARLRTSGDERWHDLAEDIGDHARVLRTLRMRPADLDVDTGISTAAKWAARRLRLRTLLVVAFGALATVLFWVPYRLTGVLAAKWNEGRDTVSTWRVLIGAAVFLVWNTGAAFLVAWWSDWRFGLATFVALPLTGVLGLRAVGDAQWTLITVRRWLIVRSGDPRIADLRSRQHDLSRRIDEALAAAEPTS
ncbi:MAG TPA: lysophospholipid acyltransferase family protein [Gemmatimonadaceae bacterium]|nr:lysophospholipid acyltransferase family protein [Gemmatimonadaceae bacterium]